MVKINRASISSALRIPHKEPYESHTFEQVECLYGDRMKDYDSNVSQSWILKLVEGGYRLPKPLTIEHFIRDIVDIMLLLNRVKGNDHAFYWES